MALLDILDCTMDELIEPIAGATPIRKSKAAGEGEVGVGGLRPKRPESPRRSVSHARCDGAGGDRRLDRCHRRPRRRAGAPLDRATIQTTVTGVAGGRAKRRGLAQALHDRPTLLVDGRSPAPRGIGDLLIALRAAGATTISPPVCAECGKPLRTLQRRGRDWYCSVCGRNRGDAPAAGQERKVATVDRRGRPRCGQCPDDEDRDRRWSSPR
jgi:hypothetical protein